VAGTHLQRYSQVLSCVEINSSFYRPHRVATYRRWAAETPRNFRFSVKLPREITHEARLRSVRRPLESFLDEVRALGTKLGPILVQLPPSLEFEQRVVRTFFGLARELHAGAIVCEPRHRSWFDGRADRLLRRLHVGRVGADPAIVPAAARPAGWLDASESAGTAYHRLHGSPRMYWSRYPRERLARTIEALATFGTLSDVWCIFDNTAGGAAIENALELRQLAGPARAS
jgi:uncharacterized protein YecE (DUF72 family)